MSYLGSCGLKASGLEHNDALSEGSPMLKIIIPNFD